TMASNAIIEGNVALTGLLTTRGFRDELEMRGQRRANIYDPNWNRLPPLVPRHLRLEIHERIRGDGEVEVPLDRASTIAAIERLQAAGVDAVAVCLMNAYLNPAHERETGRLLNHLAPGLTVCLSSDINPEIREYERSSTTVINASLVPVVTEYLDQLEASLSGLSRRLLIMQSNGGIVSAQVARKRPAVMIESGPAAGVLAAARLASENAWPAVLSFDMGGTTAKACLIENGLPLERSSGEVGADSTSGARLFGSGGHVLRVPWLDIVEVGAGGGSLAWVEEGGALRVGPRSAGADPGPACYGRGGRHPTVTDANVVLGYMNPVAIAGDRLPLDAQAAGVAVSDYVAEPLGIGVVEAAYGIVQVANATMMRALRAVSTERGRDPRGFTLVPFGGAGPMHAVMLAEAMGIKDIRIPRSPGLFSSLGLLLADYRRDFVHTLALPLKSLAFDHVRQAYAEMESAALEGLAADGIAADAVRFARRVDLRYAYQVSELSVALPILDTQLRQSLTGSFEQAHRQEFGYVRDDVIELVNLRLQASAPAATARMRDIRVCSEDQPLAEGHRRAYFGKQHGELDTSVLRREHLATRRDGPFVVEEPDTTIVVPPNWSGMVDAAGNLVLTAAKAT
ncbi:MAG: hydantoinase/oxoprolinase family protein, partial [Chromatiales bacterium]|nr:hydantoinase/oxoprolinase family protein [Chromatiales bacterium]